MSHWGRRLLMLFFAATLCAASGCFGLSQNPSYFPHLVPFGDMVQTHPKPIGPSYYANFDPHAVNIALEPLQMTSQVGSQVVCLATVRDEKGNPRRGRRVDWMVTNGNIVEVDESGCLPGRGGIFGNRAYSFTNYSENRLTRGNNNKADDVMLRPGQSWCVITSPVEGDTHLQVYVPGIFNWDQRMKTTIVRWVDAVWEFPPRAVAKFGTEHEFVTKVARHTDRQPLAKYRVRYKIIDGPPAILLPSRTQEEVAITDLNGMGKVRIAQLAPASGVNRVSVEIIRPPDPTTPSGSGVTIVAGETSVEWLAPDVKLSHVGPPAAPLGQNVSFTTSVKNDGRIDSQWVELTLPIPDGLDFVSSNPPAEPRNGQLVYPFGTLAVGQMHAVQTTFKSKRAGPVRSVALMRTAEGQNDQKDFTSQITTPQLKVDLGAPKTGIIEAPISYTIRLSNPGTGDLDDIQVIAEYVVGLEHDQVKNPTNDPKLNVLRTNIKGLKAGESKTETLVLTPKREGPLAVRVTAMSGGLQDIATAVVTVQKPNVSLRVSGPNQRYVGRPAEWKIIVKNEGEAEQTGVVVRDRLPAELGFKFASANGSFAGGEVTWNLGSLKPGQEIALDLTTECLKSAAAAEKITQLSADGGVRFERSSKLQIDGIAALKMELTDLNDPVEVGKNVQYRMILTNTGSAPASKIDVKATLPADLLKAIRAAGPTKETLAGQFITFGRVDNLQPGAKVTFMFECQALKAGRALFRVEYTSELNLQPIFEEEPTTIVAPFQSPVPAPPAGGAPMPLPPPPKN